GTFGFSQLADTMHELETIFDGLRKGRGRADEATVRLVLDSCDVFKAHLANLKAGNRGADPAMDTLHRSLADYRGGSAPAPAPAAKPQAPTEESFFEPEATAKPAAYGFFEEPAARPATTQAKDGGDKFGFFEPVVAPPPVELNRRKGDTSSIRVSVEKIDRIVNLVGE